MHLHTTASNYREKLHAALNAGCSRFDGAFKGIGGCPMAQDDLVGNMPTENMISFFEEQQISFILISRHYPKVSLLLQKFLFDAVPDLHKYKALKEPDYISR